MIKKSSVIIGSQGVSILSLFYLVVMFTLLTISSVNAQTSKLNEVVDQLVAAYNDQDPAKFRDNFGEKLLNEYSQDQIKENIGTRMSEHGAISSHKIDISPDGKRALVFVKTENLSFDLHIRINNSNKIERLEWLSHKNDPSDLSLSGHEQHMVVLKYQSYIDKFVQSIVDTNVEVLMPLMVIDENDDWTPEDYQSFLVKMNSRGFVGVGDIEVLGKNEVLVPIFFESVDMGFYLGFDKKDKISSFKITNYAPSETLGLSYTSLGSDTLKTRDLKHFNQLEDDFAADSGKVRFIALLSPT